MRIPSASLATVLHCTVLRLCQRESRETHVSAALEFNMIFTYASLLTRSSLWGLTSLPCRSTLLSISPKPSNWYVPRRSLRNFYSNEVSLKFRYFFLQNGTLDLIKFLNDNKLRLWLIQLGWIYTNFRLWVNIIYIWPRAACKHRPTLLSCF